MRDEQFSVVRSLNVRDETGRDRARLWLRPGHGPEVTVSHRSHLTAVLAATKDGRGLLGLTDSGSRAQVRLGVREEHAPSLEFVDREGKVRAKFGLEEDGTPSVTITTPTARSSGKRRGSEREAQEDADGGGDESTASGLDYRGEGRRAIRLTSAGASSTPAKSTF
jgi:hypothetical protein